MESSRRDLLNYAAEHMPILKNNQNSYHPRFSFTPKTGIAFLKIRGFSFHCVNLGIDAIRLVRGSGVR